MKKKALYFGAFLISYTPLVFAIPDGFSELYEYQKRPVKLLSLDGTQRTSLELEVNYDTVRLPTRDEESSALLTNYFKVNNIDDSLQNNIFNALKQGVKNTDECEGTFVRMYSYTRNLCFCI